MAKFSIDLKRYAKRKGEKLEDVANKAALLGAKVLIQYTPRKTGHAVQNWNFGVDRPNTMVRDVVGTNYSNVLAKAYRDIPKSFGKVLYMTNSVEYIKGLDEGRSMQNNRQGMTRPAMRAIERALR